MQLSFAVYKCDDICYSFNVINLSVDLMSVVHTNKSLCGSLFVYDVRTICALKDFNTTFDLEHRPLQ